jgi:predicted lipoprotein with Yx(FWY)xxD motif
MTRSIHTLVGLLVAVSLAIVACTAQATPPPAAGGAAAVTVATGTSPSLGVYLTGAGGKTLYILTKDTANTSTCSGACATNWPPLTVPAGGTAAAAPGVGGTFSTFARADGTTQVANKGMPLYYFAGDTKAGDTNGQGSGGVWFVATPDGGGPPAGSPAAGSPAAGSPAAGSPSPAATKGGY